MSTLKFDSALLPLDMFLDAKKAFVADQNPGKKKREGTKWQQEFDECCSRLGKASRRL